MLKRMVCGATAAMVALTPAMAGAACFSDQEWQAAHVRVLESDLQVAALECANVAGHNYNDQYQTFLQRFDDRLKAAAKLLISHFQRNYGKDSQRQLDIFITKLANDASSRSMQDMSFCANSAALFQTALSTDKAMLEQTALARVTNHDEIGEQCPAKTPTKVAVVAAKPTAPAAAKPSAPAVAKAAPVVTPAVAKVPAPAPTVGQPAAAATRPAAGTAQPAAATSQPAPAAPMPAVQSAEKPAADKPKPASAAPGSAG